MNPISQQELLREGLVWLKAQSDELLTLFIKGLALVPTDYHRNMSLEQRSWIAETILKGTIQRLEGTAIPSEQIKANFLHGLNGGAQFSELLTSLQVFLEVLSLKARYDLYEQPLVCEALIHKLTSISQMVKTSLAVAMIEHTSQDAKV